MISSALRDVLIEHIDGPVPRCVNSKTDRTVSVALREGYLRPDLEGLRYYECKRPRQTFITEKGRETLCQALAEWADALVRANLNRQFSEAFVQAAQAKEKARAADEILMRMF